MIQTSAHGVKTIAIWILQQVPCVIIVLHVQEIVLLALDMLTVPCVTQAITAPFAARSAWAVLITFVIRTLASARMAASVVIIERTIVTNKAMNVSSVNGPVHLALRMTLVNLVGLGTGELFASTRVVSAQGVKKLMGAHLAVILDIICTTTTRKKVMNVNCVILGLALLSVDPDIGETRARRSVKIIVLHVHQIQLVQVV